MSTIGNKIKKLRISKKLSQKEFAKLLYVSDKTISSWECDRTTPDINMLFSIANSLNLSIYSLINDDSLNLNNIEIGIKLKVNLEQYNKIFEIINNDHAKFEVKKQIDYYYVSKYKEFIHEWLRIRCENKNCSLTYKKKDMNNCYTEYEVMIDDYNKMVKILENIGMIKYGIIIKDRINILYNNTYKFSFDKVKNIGYFIEIKNINENTDKKTQIDEITKVLKKLNIDLNLIDSKKYFDYL